MKAIAACTLLLALVAACHMADAHSHVLFGANGAEIYDDFYPFVGGRDDINHRGMTNAGDPDAGALVGDPPMLALTVERTDSDTTVHPPTNSARSVWTQGFKDVPINTVFHSASQYDHQLFVYGGIDAEGNVLDSFRKFDLVNHRWHDIEVAVPGPDCADCAEPGALFGHCSVTDGTYLYLIGGQIEVDDNDDEPRFFWIELDNLEAGWRSRDSVDSSLEQLDGIEFSSTYATCFSFEDTSADHILGVVGGLLHPSPDTDISNRYNTYNLEDLRTGNATSPGGITLPVGLYGAAGAVWNPSISSGPPISGTDSANLFVVTGGFNNYSRALNETNMIFIDFLANTLSTNTISGSPGFNNFEDYDSDVNNGDYLYPTPRGFHNAFAWESQYYLVGGINSASFAPFTYENIEEDEANTPYCGIFYFQVQSVSSPFNLIWNPNADSRDTTSDIEITDERFIRWPLGNLDGQRNDLSHGNRGTVNYNLIP